MCVRHEPSHYGTRLFARCLPASYLPPYALTIHPFRELFCNLVRTLLGYGLHATNAQHLASYLDGAFINDRNREPIMLLHSRTPQASTRLVLRFAFGGA
jgi:hypothetical protein